ncbi:MAG: hypothetical protein HUN05_02250 [Desulfobacter sp.]|nr:MAG: hypothetical protein HUN05_02250 [Desulfobacter sp.]
MKINTSEVHYDSISQSRLSQTSRASAYYQTRGKDTVEIRDEARSEWGSRTKVQGTAVDLDDDLEKNIYLSSVFSWAADTIDLLVSEFQSQGQKDLTPSGSRQMGPGENLNPGNATADTLEDQQIDLYREMAFQFRKKADALSPVARTDQASKLKRTWQTETQNTLVRARGVVETQDGQTLNFSLDVAMERESARFSYETIQMVDPLVINFQGTAAQLSDQKMEFDLNGDGERQTIARLKSGSGFLALDLNNDKQINNGRELFGPTTGDGFRELSFYDQDQNHWIDENDAVYEQLMVWSMDAHGEDVLTKLSESGIGAIHLGNVSSDFLLTGSDNSALGQVSSSGVALTEEGAVRSVQQIDLVV